MGRKMTSIAGCNVSGCAYNKDNACHAMAITVGGPNDECPLCDTFMPSAHHGGVLDMVGGVGACKAESCTHNQDFECSMPTIRVGQHEGHPDCLTFSQK
jgi:hypothetical protein